MNMKPIKPTWFDHWFNTAFPDESYSPADIRQILRMNKDRIYRAISFGELEAFRTGGRWIIPKPAIRSWLLDGYNLN